MYEILTLIVIFLVLAVVWGINVANKSEKRDKKIGAIDDFPIGKYIAGLPNLSVLQSGY
ncbi:MAG: hypothetical protein M0P74_13530 [Syntrophales bacterium]|jgi:hypothetical protein|nr:hypothetical protein [Syntrophales bacterium]